MTYQAFVAMRPFMPNQLRPLPLHQPIINKGPWDIDVVWPRLTYTWEVDDVVFYTCNQP